MRFDPYFEKIDYYQAKGKGISVFNSSSEIFENFESKLTQSNIAHMLVRASELRSDSDFSNIENSKFRHLVFSQDLEISELKLIAEDLANRVIFPAYYRNIPISLFSVFDRTAYSEIQIESSLIHHDYTETLGVNYDHPSKSAKAKLGLPNWRFIQMQKLCKATLAANRTRMPWR